MFSHADTVHSKRNQETMKADIIKIRSYGYTTRVTVQEGKRVRTYRLPNIDQAIDFVIPRGDRHTTFYLNGYERALHAWYRNGRTTRRDKAIRQEGDRADSLAHTLVRARSVNVCSTRASEGMYEGGAPGNVLR